MFDRLIDLLIEFLSLFQFWIVIDEYEEAVVLTLGRPRNKRFLGLFGSNHLKPGFHFKWPFNIDMVYAENVVPTTTNLLTQSLTTKDGVNIVVSAVVTWQIRDIKKMLLKVEEPQRALADSTYSVIANVIESCVWEEIRDDTFNQTLTKAVRKKAFTWGIQVDDVSLADKVRTPTIRLVQE